MNPLLSLLMPIALAAPQAGPICAPGQICPPNAPPAPVLAVKVLAPAGVKVTAFPGTPAAKKYDKPVTFGFRPGYAYRLELTDLPNHPGSKLYPVVEVRGSLVPRGTMKVLEFPAPVLLTQGDIDRVIAGGMITKVIYLEDPTKAVPVESKPDEPLEFGEANEADALAKAHDSGRIVAIVRIGDRMPEAEELTRMLVSGTVLLPGETGLAPAAAPPMFPCYGVDMFDPILGPKAMTEECLTDGGDVGPRIGIGPNRKLGGLNPTDVALEYTVGGKRRVAGSNAVCVCSPRFVLRKVELIPGGLLGQASPGGVSQAIGKIVASANTPPQMVANREKPVAFLGRTKPGIMIMQQGVHTFLGLSGPAIRGTSVGLAVVGTVVEPDEITSYPNELVVTKSVDPTGPVQPGDTVTFTLTYRNNTRLPITDLLLSDSLSGRLEFVDGSAKSSRPANVTTVANEAGSVIVRFEMPGPIPPGQTGTVKFSAKVR